MRSLAKTGDLFCEAWLAFTRRSRCSFCGEAPPSQPHHFPPRGRLGYTDDSQALPACVSCHRRCHGNKVNGNAPITEDAQRYALREHVVRFIYEATPKEIRALADAVEQRQGRVVF